jgi:hypothetical protein
VEAIAAVIERWHAELAAHVAEVVTADVKVILAPPCILHSCFSTQHIQGGVTMTLTSTPNEVVAAGLGGAELDAGTLDNYGRKLHRSQLTSGSANGMSPVDTFATAHQRGIAAGVQALGFIGERAAAQGGAVAGRICELLLPFTLEEQLVDALPPGAISPAQAAYWSIEGAAFALLKLASAGAAATRMHTVKAGLAIWLAPTLWG